MDTSVYDERKLLQQVSEGDEAAFRELFYHYSDSVGSYILSLSRSKMHAEEIVQDVFLKIWMSREALAEKFKAYLYVISRNQTLNAIRKVMRQMAHQKEWEKDQTALVEINSSSKTATALWRSNRPLQHVATNVCYTGNKWGPFFTFGKVVTVLS
jgi:RNA polymerase sigma-70 factor (ECF subfamily)